MKAGRELDARIAEKIFELKWTNNLGKAIDNPTEFYSKSTLRYYGTQVADAWLVLEKIEELGWEWLMRKNNAVLWRPEWVTSNLYKARACIEATGETNSHAICLAALKAVE